MMKKTQDPPLNKDESVTTGSTVAENEDPQESSHDRSEDLNADELAAFQKIMGDIDSQEEEKLNGSASHTEAAGTKDAVLTEDERATASEAIQSIDDKDRPGVDNPPATTAEDDLATDDGDESLDEDQQRAFESIMAQIESGGAVEADAAKEAGDASKSETADDDAAELEKAVSADDTTDTPGSDAAQNDAPVNGLDQEQQQALESIMAQIEGGDTGQVAPESATGASTDSQPDDSSEDPAQRPAGSMDVKTDEVSEDVSDDIEDILAEIASSEDASDLTDTDPDDSGSVPATAEAPEETIVSDDSIAREGEASGLGHAASQAATPAGNNRKATEPVEKRLSKGPLGNPQSTKAPIPPHLTNQRKPEPLREATQSTGGRQKRAVLASVVTIIFLVLTGFFFGVPQRVVGIRTDPPDTDTRRQDAMIDIQPASQVQYPVIAVQGRSDQDRLKAATENLDRLRNELIHKQAEIEELRAYYQAGIDAEIQGIVDRVRNTGNGTIPFKSAIADPHISLGLSAIQRRDTYIKKLETPIDILSKNSEALLFFSRKSALLALMADKTSDIDIDGFIQQADQVRNEYGSELTQLNIDSVPASPRALESIWKDIEKRCQPQRSTPKTITGSATKATQPSGKIFAMVIFPRNTR
jgi:hypothetical protein